MTTVVAAVIEKDGRILIAQRAEGGWHPLKWEFPGGKVEPGESPPEALLRELSEELGIDAEIGSEIERYEYQYTGRSPIQLIFYRVQNYRGEPRNLCFEQIQWESPERLPTRDFLDGDIDFVRRLASVV